MEKNNISVYIHIPFCKRKCLYCDFASFSGKESLMLEYCCALSKEIKKIKNNVDTIYIGGGTPTYLSFEALNIIKDAVSTLNMSHDIEFTIEGNPGTFSIEKLKLIKKMGVNRLSIGFQAWQDSLLKTLGRIHSCDDFLKSYKMARKYGFNNINIDLMYALPGQTMEQWNETLNEIIKLNPEHISCYSLILEKGTAFYKMYNNNELSIPNEDIQILMYEKASEILKANGYIQYEFSNFSRKRKECRHNLTYWNLNDYIGCGSSAHSYYKGYRFRNTDNIKEYIDMMNLKDNAVVEKHNNTVKDNIEEYMFLGLRKIKGISKMEFLSKFQIDIYDLYGETIDKYKKKSLLIDDDDNIYLSKKGIEISNYILSDFLL